MSKMTHSIIVAVVTAAGVLGTVHLGRTFFASAYDLTAYLLTSKQPVASYSQSLSTYVAPYENSAVYYVHYLASSKLQLSLDQNQRRATLNRLGRLLPRDPVVPDLGPADLATEYGHFLRDNVAILAHADHNRTPLLVKIVSSIVPLVPVIGGLLVVEGAPVASSKGVIG